MDKKQKMIFSSVFNAPIFQQQFSIPENVIYYILKYSNSSKVYEKLIKTCKYFFSKSPIIVVENFSTVKYDHFSNFHTIREFKKLDLEKCLFKIWVTNGININQKTPINICKLLITKIYLCEVKVLNIHNQKLLFEEFKILTTSGTIESFTFRYSTVKYLNGQIVPLETKFEYLPKIKEAYFLNNTQPITSEIKQPITYETAEKLAQLPQMSKLESLKINHIPEIFDIETFFTLLKKPITTKYNFIFDHSISNEFKHKLQIFVDKIIQNGVTGNYPPKICFHDQSEESMNSYRKLIWQWNEKKLKS